MSNYASCKGELAGINLLAILGVLNINAILITIVSASCYKCRILVPQVPHITYIVSQVSHIKARGGGGGGGGGGKHHFFSFNICERAAEDKQVEKTGSNLWRPFKIFTVSKTKQNVATLFWRA